MNEKENKHRGRLDRTIWNARLGGDRTHVYAAIVHVSQKLEGIP